MRKTVLSRHRGRALILALPTATATFRATASTTNAFFPNVDNAYVSALFRPRAGTVVVVRGKGATNVYRKPWPVVANPQPGGGVDYGCADDDATKLDADGEYAFVVAPERQRAAVKAGGGNPASAAEAMGAYYPRAYRCTLAQFKAAGPQCG